MPAAVEAVVTAQERMEPVALEVVGPESTQPGLLEQELLIPAEVAAVVVKELLEQQVVQA